MNFLSHFYFDRNTPNANIVLGTILPDLLKNANKSWNVHPEKHAELFEKNGLDTLLQGWKRHLQVDLLFHSSDFFTSKTQDLKQLLIPILKDSPVRPSFLAHIGVELLLDHLLIEHQQIAIHSFYDNLDAVKDDDLADFLKNCNIDDTELFFKFFNGFKSSRYLLSYQKLENISFALQRICMRLWEHPFTEKTTYDLTSVLEFYKIQLEIDFMVIFEEIEIRLT
ncbi:ACP phosphodiesterase [Pedobacter xixiisoli]|uniref:Acyl carrier protein phosphodiesterase n=1 Tax=Pedobacter xixiisoli TaxID=1476464 RepID=A0A286A027_9SPHI|nr:hypothetical protein [Pedobacter xixiisoli]SOD15238.1 hypothetical protein SAMN06297358_2218 [Pedobacter xixiisoli]